MIKAEIILIKPDESLNFFSRKSGIVNESNFSVSSLNRSAIKNQEDIIPIVIPITAQISPYPMAIAALQLYKQYLQHLHYLQYLQMVLNLDLEINKMFQA